MNKNKTITHRIPKDYRIGQTLMNLCNAAVKDKDILVADIKNKPKICSVCHSRTTYMRNQKYDTDKGMKISINTQEVWLNYGKYALICKRCYDRRYKERKKEEKMYRIG